MADSNEHNERDFEVEVKLMTEPPPKQSYEESEEKLLLKNAIEEAKSNKKCGIVVPKVEDWRFGPAQMWYDMIGVPENGEGFDYGFKLAEEVEGKEPNREDLLEDAFLLVSQLLWEDEIIWDCDEVKIEASLSKNHAASWVLLNDDKTDQAQSKPGNGILVPEAKNVTLATYQISMPLETQWQKINMSNDKEQQQQSDTWYSIFPVENKDLVNGTWEEDIIWDAQRMKKIPEPKIPTLDPNDENIVLDIPDDKDPTMLHESDKSLPKAKKHEKKSKLSLIEKFSKSPNKDPFNISNDKYYMPVLLETTFELSSTGSGDNFIQHSVPVVKLRAPFIQTRMGPTRLRNYHRPPLKRCTDSILYKSAFSKVLSLSKYIRNKVKTREQERIASGGVEIFFMKTAEDLTGRDGELVLVEFSEEYPPLMNQVGMCSKIKNYYKPGEVNDQGLSNYKYGEIEYENTNTFLGTLKPGQSIQTVENKMYRAPIYEHAMPQTDFLIIRSKQQYYIREIDALFLAGQECPLYEVPRPNSRRVTNFERDFLNVFLYKLFLKSTDLPRRIKTGDVKKAFPQLLNKSIISTRLKFFADFVKTGEYAGNWVLKPEFRLPSEDEINAMVSPEEYCAYFSMMAAVQRLKDAGYGEKFFFMPQDEDNEDEEELQLKMDDEIKAAPWNTTRAYIQAMKGKCLLQLAGPADPTGCGEGFSYVVESKRINRNADSDLRYMSMKTAKETLLGHSVSEEVVKKLSRLEAIEMVRDLTTKKSKTSTAEDTAAMLSCKEKQEQFKQECQRIFDLQNWVLASDEILSTDEEESSEEDSSDVEEMGRIVEDMLRNKKTSSQLSFEREEQLRRELKEMMLMDDDSGAQDDKIEKNEKNENSTIKSFRSKPGQVLKIYRKYQTPEGKNITCVEYVRRPEVIDTYIKIRTSKDETFIKKFAQSDETYKKEKTQEKKRIQAQLRLIKRKIGDTSSNFNNSTQSNVVLTSDHISPATTSNISSGRRNSMNISKSKEQNFANVDDTEVDLFSKLSKQPKEEPKRCSMKASKNAKSSSKKRKRQQDEENKQIALSLVLNSCLEKLKSMKEASQFLIPVNKKLAKNYYKIIKNPMDLETMRKNVAVHYYHTREDFMADLQLIHSNCVLFNKKKSPLILKAEALVKAAEKFLENIQCGEPPEKKKALKRSNSDDDDINHTRLTENQASLPEPDFNKSSMDDCDFQNANEAFPHTESQKESLLEEDLQISSDDNDD